MTLENSKAGSSKHSFIRFVISRLVPLAIYVFSLFSDLKRTSQALREKYTTVKSMEDPNIHFHPSVPYSNGSAHQRLCCQEKRE